METENISGQFDVVFDRVTRISAIKRGGKFGPFFDNWNDAVDWGEDTNCGAIELKEYDCQPLSGSTASLAEIYFTFMNR